MRWIASGTFRMGEDNAYPEEAPSHRVTVSGFLIDRYPVTDADFANFVTATGYRTVAERPLDPAAYPGADPNLLTPGSAVFFMPTGRVNLGDFRSCWALCAGCLLASTRRPWKYDRRPRAPPSGPCDVRGCRGVRRLGQQSAPHRGGMGIA